VSITPEDIRSAHRSLGRQLNCFSESCWTEPILRFAGSTPIEYGQARKAFRDAGRLIWIPVCWLVVPQLGQG